MSENQNTSPEIIGDVLSDAFDLDNLLSESERDSVETYNESLKSRGTKAKTSFRNKSYDELTTLDAIDAFKSLFPESKYSTQYTMMGVKLGKYIQNNINGSFPDYLKSDNIKPTGNNHYRYKPMNYLFWVYSKNDSDRFVKGNIRSDWLARTKWFVWKITARTTLDYQAWVDSITAEATVEPVTGTVEAVKVSAENLADKMEAAEAPEDAGVDAEAARQTNNATKAAKRKELADKAMKAYPKLSKRAALKQLKKDWKDAAENKKGLE